MGMEMNMFSAMGKILIIMGLIIVVIGALMILGPRIPFIGRLPGDIYVRRENFVFYFPITTSILISIILSLILFLIGRFR